MTRGSERVGFSSRRLVFSDSCRSSGAGRDVAKKYGSLLRACGSLTVGRNAGSMMA
jgi:hypothetical protein